ncbi:MAG: hypothetical protein ABSC90_08885 [Acidimicrobiales bacterium]|jgi:hypothetical protein
MTTSVVVRYTTRPERADENERLIRAVFAELADTHPEGFRYVATRLSDGVSFVHVATLDGGVNPLDGSPAFATFLAGIGDRCVDPPEATQGTAVGLYFSGR